MVLLLKNEEIQTLLDVCSCIEAVESAYAALARGEAVHRPVEHTYMPLSAPHLDYCLKTMCGGMSALGRMVLRVTSDVISSAKVHGVVRREKLPHEPGGRYYGLLMLFDIHSGALLAIMDDGYIQVNRVAAASAIATRILANPGAGDMGLLGSSGQAWAHLRAIAAVRPIRRVRVFSPNAAHRHDFVNHARKMLDLAVQPVGSAREAVEGADLVVAATNTSEPVFQGGWLTRGAHVVSIAGGDSKLQRRELDDETYRRAGVVIANVKQRAMSEGQADLAEPVRRGILSWEGIHDLSDLVAGRAPGRSSAEDITVFKNNTGLALQFTAVCSKLYDAARGKGIGRELPDSYFSQDMKP